MPQLLLSLRMVFLGDPQPGSINAEISALLREDKEKGTTTARDTIRAHMQKHAGAPAPADGAAAGGGGGGGP